ncbi:MAG: 50S ribosomal protein L7ae [Candidatus Diapherotrites archaeon]|nr:50S ribosomal protein L7ae [Candidatus Diapherotrites archaeon]
MADYVKFSVPKEISEAQTDLIKKIKKTGKIRVGANEATKAVERKTAKIIFIAGDVTPPEIVMHLPVLCKEKSIPFTYFPTKADLGTAAGISVGTAAIAVTEEGDAKKDLESLVKKLAELSGGKPVKEKEEHTEKPKEKVKEEKPEHKEEKEKPKEEKKESKAKTEKPKKEKKE